ncbi:DDE_3 domain-containing protein [Trichonephila clavipes]|nr:DDE_3 domain-containing protein [Trichonephila clavipes]
MNKVFESQVRLFRDAVGPEVLLINNNARPHPRYVVTKYLKTEDIPRMDWLPYSSDLKPIEHVWDALGYQIPLRPSRS